MIVEGQMDSILIPISKTSTNTHVEISCLSAVVACTLVGTSALSVPLFMEANVFNRLFAGHIFPCILVIVK